MQTVALVLFLLLAVVLGDLLSRVCARHLPFVIPRPLIQIALGGLIGMWTQRAVVLEPEVFFLLFLPPLLFLDGWRIPSEELFRDKGTISQLAFGLVVFTVLGMGFFMHWLIPAMPLPVAFALAAVISPTDPIAVAAIAQRVPISRRMMHILEGESLLNDASGLVCFRFAVAALLTGTFSMYSAAVDLVWTAAGGLAVGVGLPLALSAFKRWLADLLGEDSGSQIIISLLIPFGCYLLAEMLSCSGILAVVAAGLTVSYVEARGHAHALTRIRSKSFWDVIQFAATGAIFVLLGEQLHGIVARAATTVQLTGQTHPLWLLAYVLAVFAGLAAMRFAWVYFSLRVMLFVSRRAGAVRVAGSEESPASVVPADRPHRPGWQLVSAMSLAGVRGTVTMAGVLSLPLAMPDGTPFPARDLAISLAMGVIIVSLLVATIGLPWLLQGLEMPVDRWGEAEEGRARIAAAHAAIAAITAIMDSKGKRLGDHADVELVATAAARVMEIYQARIEARAGDDREIALAKRGEVIERQIRIAAINAEREDVFRELRARKLGTETAEKLIRELDLLEARYSV